MNSEHSANAAPRISDDTPEPAPPVGPSLSPSLSLALALVAGIRLADFWQVSPGAALLGTAGLIAAAGLLDSGRRSTSATVSLLLAAVLLGSALWSLREQTIPADDIRHLDAAPDETVRVTGVIVSIPAERTVRSVPRPAAGGSPNLQTTFHLRLRELLTADRSQPVSGTVRTVVAGTAAGLPRWGDRVQVTGRLETDFPINNPGEFDYQSFLRHQSVSGVLSVKHPAAIVALQQHSNWSPRALITDLRRSMSGLIEREITPRVRPLAEALLLGNRGHLDPAVERDFIASGTMHLLAISGLHVGILWLFLIRLMNLLLVSRSRGMLIAVACCAVYAILTDLRPSVLRATVFMGLCVVAQLVNRDVRMPSLIGNTAILLILFDPGIAFDVGAWLSFLAVAALGWVTDQSPQNQRGDVPPDALTWSERGREILRITQTRLALRYRQTIAVTVFSTPLVASLFHVVSAVSIVINLLLIPLTGVVMICGFVFLAAGLLLPPLGSLTGVVFSLLLALLNDLVVRAAGLGASHVTIPDLPNWFLVGYYVLLAAAICLGSRRLARLCWTGLAVSVILMFWCVNQRPVVSDLRCTVLSVGHGNAVVVETPDQRVLLFDAGAMFRSERTAEVIARFLWSRGHRLLDAVIVSHADEDHYNAVAGLVDRVVVGELITTQEVARSEAAPVQQLFSVLRDRRIPVRLAFHGDSLWCGGLSVRFFQAAARPDTPLDDNELSLVSVLAYAGRRVALPGDLERRGAAVLLPQLAAADVLVSPHHGSQSANTPLAAERLQPAVLIVSDKDNRNDTRLQQTYGPRTRILNTSTAGAAFITVRNDSGITWESYRGTAFPVPSDLR